LVLTPYGSFVIDNVQDRTELGKRSTVLVAEDNLVNQTVIRKLLEKLGYDSELAENGQRAVELASKGGCVAVLMTAKCRR
jgi:PleD family two-component response regulator